MPAPATGTPRLPAIDALRGLIMMTMALDHARAFVARDHAFESWAAPLPHYDSALPFLTRLVTHLCAPGFFFLMGVGMTLLASARHEAGWSDARVAGYFVRRGFVLLLVEQFIENPAWIIGLLGAAPADAATAADPPFLVFGVLYALGMAMIFWSLLVRTPASLIVAASVAAILATQILTPPQSQAEVAFSPLLRLLLVPGQTGPWFVLYPAVPWLGLTGLGIAFGRTLRAKAESTSRRSLAWGAAALAAFVAVRLHGGFGNIHLPVPPGWIGFLNVTKYPPSLAFVLLTLGANLVLFAGFSVASSRWTPGRTQGSPLLVFGRTPLFFYIVHLYLFALIGLAFPHGANLLIVYPVWLLGLVILYPLCTRYQGFKQKKPAESPWRLF